MTVSDRPNPGSPSLRDRRGRVYTPAVGAKLRPWLWMVLGGFALLGANGIYLTSVTFLTWLKGAPQDTYFYMLMVALHLLLGLLIVVPFLVFGLTHLATSWKRPNRAAVRNGLLLLAAAFVVLISGLVLLRLDVPLAAATRGAIARLKFEVKDPRVRDVGYWLHIATPLLAILLYVRHRLAGPRIRWQYLRLWGAAVGVFVVAMGVLHTQDPRTFGKRGPREGAKYFFPSEVKTADGNLIPASTLMMDQYCMSCHKDSYDGWFHSAHHFSSFNNKAYLFSVRETREVSIERDGDTRAARWCAGCHDPVPFLSGKFDDPNYDDVNDSTAHAGITCTACHSITHVNSTRGNADYTIEEPQHYPFATSENPILQWVNQTLVKAKPELHKRTFLKPLHRDKDFCSTCHKVALPFALNHYKDFLRGQNHHDSYILSGVSGRGARSFYYPPVAKTSCTECHMNLVASNDFGAQDFDGKPGREVHDHLFLGANTGLAAIRGREDIVERHAKYLKDQKVRIDIFGLREGGEIDGKLLGPIRPAAPEVQPGKPYLVEVVVRTLGVGHHLTQGTVDSNEIWVELIARAGDRVIGRSGGIGDDGSVDPYAHFINVYMLDRNGKRIDRRNAQDIFVPLYNKQVPPGAGQVVHFGLDVPEGLTEPITLEARVNYRKFDRIYMDHVFGEGQKPTLPVVDMAKDVVKLPIAGGPAVENPPSPIKNEWQRWNDYGIGLFLEGEETGAQKGNLKQAEEIFKKVAELGVADGWVNLARVYQREGRIPDALAALDKASKHPKPAATWTINWLTGQINARNGFLDEAIANFQSVLDTRIDDRKFNFRYDYEVLNALGLVLDRRARVETIDSPERLQWMSKAIGIFRETLAIDADNVAAHYGLGQAYAEFARAAKASPGAKGSQAKVDDASIAEAVQALANPLLNAQKIPAKAQALAADLDTFLASERPEFGSRVGPLVELIEKVGKVWVGQSDPTARAELARVLEKAHKAMHAMVKPDESAQGRAVRIARQNDPAANQNAQPIVIHPMHRAGAPGIDPPVDASKAAAVTPNSSALTGDATE